MGLIDNNTNIETELQEKLKATSLSESEIKEIIPEILKLTNEIKEDVENNQTESTTKNFLLDLRQDVTNNSNVSIDIKRNKGTIIGTIELNNITNNIYVINKPETQSAIETSSQQSEIQPTTQTSLQQSEIQPTTQISSQQPEIQSATQISSQQPEVQPTTQISSQQPEIQPTTQTSSQQPEIQSATQISSQQSEIQPTTQISSQQPETQSATQSTAQLDQPNLKLDSYAWYDKELSDLLLEIDGCISTAKYKRGLNKSGKETLKTAKAKLDQYKDIVKAKQKNLKHEFKQKNKLNKKNPDKTPLIVSISASEIDGLKRRRGDRRKKIEEDIKAGQMGESSDIAPWPNQSLEQVKKGNKVDRHHIEYDSKLNEALQDAALLRVFDNNQDRVREFLQGIANNSLSDAQITICQMYRSQLDPCFQKYGLTDQVHRCIQTRGGRYTQSVDNYGNIDGETAYKTGGVVGWLKNTLIKAFPNAKPEQVSNFTNIAVAAGGIYAIYRIGKWFFGKNEKGERNLGWKAAGLAGIYFAPQLLLGKDGFSLLGDILSGKADFGELGYRASNCLWFLKNGSPEVYEQMAPGVLGMTIFPQNYTVKDVRALQQTFSDQNARRQWYTTTYNRLNNDNSALANEFKNTFNANQYNENERKVFLAKLGVTENTGNDIKIFNEAVKLTDKKTSLGLWMKSQGKKKNPVFEKEIDNYLKQGGEFNPNDLKDKEDSWFIPDVEATYTERREDKDFKEKLTNQIDTLSVDDTQKTKLKTALQKFYDERNIGSKPLISDFSLKMENNLLILTSHKGQEARIDIDNKELVGFGNGIRFSDLSELLNVADLSNKILESQKGKQPKNMPPFQYKGPTTILENGVGKKGRGIYFNDAESFFDFDTRVLSGGRGGAIGKIDTLSQHSDDFAKYLSKRWEESNKVSLETTTYPILSKSGIEFYNEEEAKQAETRLNQVKQDRRLENGGPKRHEPFSIEGNKLVFTRLNGVKIYYPNSFSNDFSGKAQDLSNFPTIIANKDKFLAYMNNQNNGMRGFALKKK